jgi:hypothetical protein
MNIRQLAVHYHAQADRLLLRVRSSNDAVFAVWLTRRLCLRLWPLLSSVVVRASAAQAAPQAVATPEANAMLAEATRERVLQQADFSQPFQERCAHAPLGTEPLLAHTVQLTPRAAGHLQLAISDAQQRQLQLELDASLAAAVRELVIAALRQADWGFALDSANAAAPAAAPRVLN